MGSCKVSFTLLNSTGGQLAGLPDSSLALARAAPKTQLQRTRSKGLYPSDSAKAGAQRRRPSLPAWERAALRQSLVSGSWDLVSGWDADSRQRHRNAGETAADGTAVNRAPTDGVSLSDLLRHRPAGQHYITETYNA